MNISSPYSRQEAPNAQLERLAEAQTPVSQTRESQPHRPDSTRPVALDRRRSRRLGAQPLRELLLNFRPRVRRHQAARRRRSQGAPQDLQPGRPGWQSAQAVGRPAPPGAETPR